MLLIPQSPALSWTQLSSTGAEGTPETAPSPLRASLSSSDHERTSASSVRLAWECPGSLGGHPQLGARVTTASSALVSFALLANTGEVGTERRREGGRHTTKLGRNLSSSS